MSDDAILSYTRAALVIRLDLVRSNISAVRGMIDTNSMIMAVVKANGYGHGAVQVSEAALVAGADWLGVATIKEGLQLRAAGIVAPILVLSPVFEEDYPKLLQGGLTSTCLSLLACEKLSRLAASEGLQAAIHIKIDTGMNRIGYNHRDVDAIIADICAMRSLPGVFVQGIYSHLATSDSDADFAKLQFQNFSKVLKELERSDVHIPIRHISNSGGVLNHPEFNLDMVRCGVLTYGLAPCSTAAGAAQLQELGIQPALSLKSRVAFVKTVKAGESVGYARNYTALRDMVVATVPIGYADGISRQLSNKGKVLINGFMCNIIGNVCMDQLMVDATPANSAVSDEVVFIGSDGPNNILAEDMAQLQGSINYEVATSMSLRIPAYYL
jgi:alanine racemase